MAKKEKTVKRGSNKVVTPVEEAQKLNPNLDSMNFWRDFAKQVCPNVSDPVQQGEVALMLQQHSKLIGIEFENFSEICDKNADTTIKIGIQVGIDRRTQPSEVSTKLGYSEKHSSTVKSQVPDPNQDELPGITVAAGTSETNGGAGLGEDPGE